MNTSLLDLPDDVLTHHLNPYLNTMDSMALREALQFKIYIKRKLNPSLHIKVLTLYAECAKIYPSHPITPDAILESYYKCVYILNDVVRISSPREACRYLKAFQDSVKNNMDLIQDQLKELNSPLPSFIASLPQTAPELESLLKRFTQFHTKLMCLNK